MGHRSSSESLLLPPGPLTDVHVIGLWGEARETRQADAEMTRAWEWMRMKMMMCSHSIYSGNNAS